MANEERAIITITDIQEIFGIGKNLSDQRVNGIILQSQISDLEAFLGDELYYLFVQDIQTDAPTQRFTDLFQGVEYLNDGGKTVYFRGVRRLLASYAYTRLLKTNWFNVTRAGNTIKTVPESTGVTLTQNQQKVRDSAAFAGRLEDDTRRYLDQESNQFPEWDRRRNEVRGGKRSFRFFRM